MAGFDPRSWARLAAVALALGATAALPQPGAGNAGGANAGDQGRNANQPSQGGANAQGGQGQQRPAPALAVIKLQNADPQQVAQLLRALDQPAPHSAGYRGEAADEAAHHAQAVAAQQAARGGLAAPQTQQPQGQQPKAQPSQPQQPQFEPLRIAADARSKSLFVRGDQGRIEQVKQLVQALDAGGDVKAMQFGDARIVPIRYANHAEVMGILNQLQLPSTTFQLGKQGVVVLRGGEGDSLSQAEQVIQALDQQSQQDANGQPQQQGGGGQGGQGNPGQGGQGGAGGAKSP